MYIFIMAECLLVGNNAASPNIQKSCAKPPLQSEIAFKITRLNHHQQQPEAVHFGFFHLPSGAGTFIVCLRVCHIVMKARNVLKTP